MTRKYSRHTVSHTAGFKDVFLWFCGANEPNLYLSVCLLTNSLLVVLLCGHIATDAPVVSQCWSKPKCSLPVQNQPQTATFISFCFFSDLVKLFMGYFTQHCRSEAGCSSIDDSGATRSCCLPAWALPRCVLMNAFHISSVIYVAWKIDVVEHRVWFKGTVLSVQLFCQVDKLNPFSSAFKEGLIELWIGNTLSCLCVSSQIGDTPYGLDELCSTLVFSQRNLQTWCVTVLDHSHLQQNETVVVVFS